MVRTSKSGYLTDWLSFPWVGFQHYTGDEEFGEMLGLLVLVVVIDLVAALLVIATTLVTIFVLEYTGVTLVLIVLAAYLVAGQVANLIWKMIMGTRLF